MVYVSGDLEGLGLWKTENSVPLTKKGGSIWTGTVILPASKKFQYKYFKKGKSSTINWEADPNHKGTTAEMGQRSVLQNFFRSKA